MCKDLDIWSNMSSLCHLNWLKPTEPKNFQVQPQFLLVILSVSLLGESLAAMKFSIASVWFVKFSIYQNIHGFSRTWSANAEFWWILVCLCCFTGGYLQDFARFVGWGHFLQRFTLQWNSEVPSRHSRMCCYIIISECQPNINAPPVDKYGGMGGTIMTIIVGSCWIQKLEFSRAWEPRFGGSARGMRLYLQWSRPGPLKGEIFIAFRSTWWAGWLSGLKL